MTFDEAFILDAVGLPGLTGIARQAAGVANLTLGAWGIQQIAGGLGNPVSVGLFRVEGVGRAGGEQRPWSAILKIIQSPANVGQTNLGEGNDPTHWNFWRRELLVYQSGLLQTLPAGLTAPRFFGSNELSGDMVCLWLEEVADDYQDVWPPERYALTARHLGRLNGQYAGEQPPSAYPWLGRGRLRQWRDLFPAWQLMQWNHPLVRSLYPEAETVNMRRLLSESEQFLQLLERLPHTLCHGDAYPTNFKSRRAAGGEQTVALDWALAHFGPVGYDLGLLALGAYLNIAASDLAEVDRELFAAYMAGLRDSGYAGDPATVRFAYAASAVLTIALFELAMLHYGLMQEEATSPVTIETGALPAQRPNFEGALADIAYELLDSIR